MPAQNWKELLGLKNTDINEADLASEIARAKAQNLSEISLKLKNGETIKIKFNATKDEGILSSNAWCW